MRLLLRQAARHVLIALAIGLALRLWFIHAYPLIEGDSLTYADLARNWFWHGTFGFTTDTGIQPTLIRLPGYPLFLAVCFFLFGLTNYHTVLLVQAVMDLATCLLVAGFAARTISRRAGIATLYLAAVCPFTANYVASPLTETPTLFFIALALYAFSHYAKDPRVDKWFFILAFSISYETLLRPDGALLGFTLIPAMFWYARAHVPAARSAKFAIICGLLTLIPFVPWTIRNARTMHVFQPLVPRYANEPGEFVAHGWGHWVKTWCVEFVSTEEILWNVNGDPIDIHNLPSRAFDNPQQYAETASLFDAYNKTDYIDPKLDARFGALANQRIRNHPFRYYVTLPLLRVADMWLRPRTESLWIEARWWASYYHPEESAFALAYAGLNLAYILLALWGLTKRVPYAGAMVAYIVMRCMLLYTVANPEQRYTLECFPMIFILAGAALTVRSARRSTSRHATSGPPEFSSSS